MGGSFSWSTSFEFGFLKFPGRDFAQVGWCQFGEGESQGMGERREGGKTRSTKVHVGSELITCTCRPLASRTGMQPLKVWCLRLSLPE